MAVGVEKSLNPAQKFDLAVPGARALLGSLRGVGYSPWTAVADLIDNSITAGARRVRVDFAWRGSSSYVRILDDGHGMDEQALISAMRLGSRSSAKERSAHDLGRFGLGLKTASLSQCRVLTVVSKQNGHTASRRWDLDYVESIDEWHLLPGPPEDAGDEVKIPSDLKSGTLVLWTKLDRLVGSAEEDDTAARKRFFETARLVERHLAMTFHRFMEPPRPRLEIFFNGSGQESRTEPWDPFMQWHPATTASPIETISYGRGKVEVQGFVLPHKDMLTPEQLETGGGPEGWLAHQGFFVYRNHRLLVPGGWMALGLGRRWVRDEIHRLARIRLDFPNTLDDEWKIDIRKSIAVPPPALQSYLRRLAERIRTDAREVFAHRGGRGIRASCNPIIRAWTAVDSSQGISYRVDRGHPSVKRVLDWAEDHRPMIEEMLRVIEATVPVQRIWLDMAEKDDVSSSRSVSDLDADVSGLLQSLYSHMLNDLRLTPQEARRRLLSIEPFCNYPAVIGALPDVVK